MQRQQARYDGERTTWEFSVNLVTLWEVVPFRLSPFQIRLALSTDVPALSQLIDLSVRTLQTNEYTPAQITGALASVFGVDTQLIADQTYFAVETATGELVACGGWSKRKTLYGGDQASGREPELLNPATDAAKIRAFFVHPRWVRQGIATLLLNHCEQAAVAAGFARFEMGATLTGVPLYTVRGYSELEAVEVPLANGKTLPIVRMAKNA
jgi:GNAT superfamily N-acetyltransferase